MKYLRNAIRCNGYYINPFKYNYSNYIQPIVPEYLNYDKKENNGSNLARKEASDILCKHNSWLLNLIERKNISNQKIRAIQYCPLHIFEYYHINSLKELKELIIMSKEARNNPRNALLYENLIKLFWEKEKEKQKKEGVEMQIGRAGWGSSGQRIERTSHFYDE